MVSKYFASFGPHPVILRYRGPLRKTVEDDEARRVRVTEKDYDFHMFVPEVPVLESSFDTDYIDRIIYGEFRSIYGSGYLHHQVISAIGSISNDNSSVFLNVLVTIRGEDRLEFYVVKTLKHLKNLWRDSWI